MRKRRSNGHPTIADVALRAGVGAITVSRALRNPDKVSEALRKSIDDAVRELNYIPNRNASALASSRTDVVAVLVPSLTQNIFSDVVRGVYDGAEDSGLRVEIANTRYSIETEERQIFDILRHEPAAIVVSGIDQSANSRKMLEKAGCPVIQIMDLTDDPVHRIIGFSHVAAGKAMTQHLIDSGYKRIAFFGGGWMNSRSKGRLNGYIEALKEADLFDPKLIAQVENKEPWTSQRSVRDYHHMSTAGMGRELMQQALDGDQAIDAVFCNNDVVALGALFACIAEQVDVPRQIGIAGFNDFDYMQAAQPAMSTVRIHRWQCGYLAMQAVKSELNGEPVGERITDIGFDIVKRASTDRSGLLSASAD